MTGLTSLSNSTTSTRGASASAAAAGITRRSAATVAARRRPSARPRGAFTTLPTVPAPLSDQGSDPSGSTPRSAAGPQPSRSQSVREGCERLAAEAQGAPPLWPRRWPDASSSSSRSPWPFPASPPRARLARGARARRSAARARSAPRDPDAVPARRDPLARPGAGRAADAVDDRAVVGLDARAGGDRGRAGLRQRRAPHDRASWRVGAPVWVGRAVAVEVRTVGRVTRARALTVRSPVSKVPLRRRRLTRRPAARRACGMAGRRGDRQGQAELRGHAADGARPSHGRDEHVHAAPGARRSCARSSSTTSRATAGTTSATTRSSTASARSTRVAPAASTATWSGPTRAGSTPARSASR